MQPANCALLSRSFLLPHAYHAFSPLPSPLLSLLFSPSLPLSLSFPPSLPPSPLPYLSFNLSHTHTLSHQYLYAFTVTPLSEMDVHELIQQPPAVTDCPYTDLLRSKQICMACFQPASPVFQNMSLLCLHCHQSWDSHQLSICGLGCLKIALFRPFQLHVPLLFLFHPLWLPPRRLCIHIQWNLRIKDKLVHGPLSTIRGLSFIGEFLSKSLICVL